MPETMAVMKGTLDVLVLKAVARQALHGFEITEWLESRSNGSLEVEDSAIYQAVYRLEGRELIEADWGVTGNNRRARYYSITAAGRAHLRAQTAQWLRYSAVVSSILTAPVRGAES
jgi:transcriptional regulator